MFLLKYSLFLSALLMLSLSHCASGNRKESDKNPGTAQPSSTPAPTANPDSVQNDNDDGQPRPGENQAGSTNNIGGVFQLLPTNVVDPEDAEGDFCDQEENLGTIVRSNDGGDYQTCLGESLSFGQATARYFKAFKTPDDFFRPLTGSVTIIATPTGYDWQCFRLPEKTRHSGSADQGAATDDLCDDVFAFKVAVPNGNDPGTITFEFNGRSL